MKHTIFALLLLSTPGFAQKTLGHGARFRSACVTRLSQWQPEELATLPSTPAAFCECVSGRHERYARETFARPSDQVAYLSNILLLYRVDGDDEATRVAAEYRDEADQDRGVRRICKSK